MKDDFQQEKLNIKPFFNIMSDFCVAHISGNVENICTRPPLKKNLPERRVINLIHNVCFSSTIAYKCFSDDEQIKSEIDDFVNVGDRILIIGQLYKKLTETVQFVGSSKIIRRYRDIMIRIKSLNVLTSKKYTEDELLKFWHKHDNK